MCILRREGFLFFPLQTTAWWNEILAEFFQTANCEPSWKTHAHNPGEVALFLCPFTDIFRGPSLTAAEMKCWSHSLIWPPNFSKLWTTWAVFDAIVLRIDDWFFAWDVIVILHPWSTSSTVQCAREKIRSCYDLFMSLNIAFENLIDL